MLGKGTKRHMPTKQVQAQKTKHKPNQALGARDSELLLTYLTASLGLATARNVPGFTWDWLCVSTVQWLLEV